MPQHAVTSPLTRRLSLALVVHSHQPIGNFDDVIARAYAQAYEPFLHCVERHPAIHLTLHFTGSLLDWLLEHRPSYVGQLQRLVARGQVELLGGGYYEPILAIIPSADRVRQIRLLRDRLEEVFGVPPRGAWLAERVWEQHLTRSLAEAGVEYLVLDENHFTQAGVPADRLGQCVLTEDEGYRVTLVPASESLRYAIPFREPEESIRLLSEVYRSGWSVITYADDGEKFGLWPHTSEWVYGQRWLDRFFSAVEQQADWLQPMTLGEMIDGHPVQQRWYLPPGSYREMLEWSGGYFRNFFVKYPEANALHKRMLRVSRQLAAVEQTLQNGPKVSAAKSRGVRGDRRQAVLNDAYRQLYMGQCNDAYWHGIFGGLYLHHLRHTVYQHLIEAERLGEAAAGASTGVRVETDDVDWDGDAEIVVTTPEQVVLFDPSDGGIVTEWDVRHRGLNLLNTLARRPEAYHKAAHEAVVSASGAAGGPPLSIHSALGAKEQGLTDRLVYDVHRRAAWIDHLLPTELDPQAWWQQRYPEWGDFAGRPFAYRAKGGAKQGVIVLERRGEAITDQGAWPIVLEKTFRVPSSGVSMDVTYRVTNEADRPFAALLAVELNASVYDDRYSVVPGVLEPSGRLEICDRWTGARMTHEMELAPAVWYSPIDTVSESEEGLERTYQELCWVLVWPLALAGGATWTATVRQAVVTE